MTDSIPIRVINLRRILALAAPSASNVGDAAEDKRSRDGGHVREGGVKIDRFVGQPWGYIVYDKTTEKEKHQLKNTASLLTTGACAALLALTAFWGTAPAHAAPTVGSNEHNIKRNTSIGMQNRARLMQNRRRVMQNRRMIMQNRRMIRSHQSGSMMHHNMMHPKAM